LDLLKVEYDGEIYEAQWCEELSNPEIDIAILKINVTNAKAVPIINPQQLSTSVTVYGFPPTKKKNFPEGFAVSAQSIDRSAPLKTVSTYGTQEIKFTNSWNKLPQETSTFLSHRIDAKVESGTSGGAVFAEELGGVVGVIQCSKSDESYVIRWDNITAQLDQLGLEPEKNGVCQFLQEIEDYFKYIKLFHTQQPILLKEQYIPIQVSLETKRKDVENFWEYGESEAELKRAYALKRMGEESQRTQVDWEEAKKENQKIMVLADPGMGKSTLLRMEAGLTAQAQRQKLLARTHANPLVQGEAAKPHPNPLLQGEGVINDVIFPLFIRLSDLDEQATEVIDTIRIIIQRDYPKTAPRVKHLLEEKLKNGKCLLLLDALDEVPKEHRNDLQKKLNRFARNYPCPIICTSRIVGYGGAFVESAKEVEIVPFSQKQTEQYIETWFTNAAGYIEDDSVSAEKLIEELRHKPQITGLAQNPLLLSLLCSLYQEKGLTLPARRTQVYEEAVNYMLSKWRSDNRRQSSLDGWVIAKIQLLESLAYQFSSG
jgi:energy-coupling factor transporter ATP-binding protein EcfA2